MSVPNHPIYNSHSLRKAVVVMSTITDNMEDILMDDSKITMVTGVDHIRQG